MVSSDVVSFFPHPLQDDLSAFGSSIVFSWPGHHSGTGLGGWLSLMKNLSYLILHCLKLQRYLYKLFSNLLRRKQLTILLRTKTQSRREQLLIYGPRVFACDKEEKYETLRTEFSDRVNTSYIAYPSTSAEKSIETNQDISQWSSGLQSKRLHNLQRGSGIDW